MWLYRLKIGWGIVAVLTACSGWAQDAREDMFLDSYEVICMLGHVLALEPDPAEKNQSFGI